MSDPKESPVTFIYEKGQPRRLDKFLVVCLPELSRSRIQNLIKDRMISVDGAVPHKTGISLLGGAVVQVRIPPPVPSNLVPEAIPLAIVYEDDNLMVVDKPAGMVVHPSAGHSTGTLVHAALAHAPEMEGIGGEQRPGVVHRLDKNTSGLIMLAKNDHSHRWLQDQFRRREVTKKYLALVDGKPPTPTGRVEAPIGRDLKTRKKMAIVPPNKGRSSTSEYYTLEEFSKHSFMEVQPVTGRTHQIRLHMAFIGCPVVGDTIYGKRNPSIKIKRHFLHAARLHIKLPDQVEGHTFQAPLPEELATVLEELRRSGG